MGQQCCSSVEQPTKQSLANRETKNSAHFKVLLLGAGESGKSTLIKQLTFIHKTDVISHHGQSLTPAKLMDTYTEALQMNTIQSMQSLLQEAITSGANLGHYVLAAKSIMSLTTGSQFTMITAQAIQELWTKCPAITAIWQRRSTFWVLECANYYFSHCHRFAQPGFQPTEQDIIMARKRTTGVVTTEFGYGDTRWSVIDVGGQRNERKKWLHYFDDVQAIAYVVNLAAYNRVLFEDQKVNAMQEDIELFGTIAGNPLFRTIPIYLLLNKKDLFQQQLETANISKCFPDYDGLPEPDACMHYINSQFQQQMPRNKGLAGSYYISAHCKDDVKYAFDDIKRGLLEGKTLVTPTPSKVTVVSPSSSSVKRVVVKPITRPPPLPGSLSATSSITTKSTTVS